MIILTVDEIIALQIKLIAATGGSDGLRDHALLESAVMNCYQTFGGEELYPGVIEKAARLALEFVPTILSLTATSAPLSRRCLLSCGSIIFQSAFRRWN